MAEVTHSVIVGASQETVFEWISQAEHLKTWFADEVSREDDELSFSWKMQDGGSVSFDASITVDDSPTTFAYVSHEEKPTTSHFELVADGEKTTVTVIESGFADDGSDAESMAEHEGGWQFFFSRLQGMAS